MKLFIVLLTHIDNLPPARNLLLALTKQNVQVELITMYSDALPSEIVTADNMHIIDVQPKVAPNKLFALLRRFFRRHTVRTILKQVKAEDVIWTVTDYDAMEVGSILNQHRHVMQLMELIHDIPYFDEIPVFKAHIDRYGRNAELVIVPEYNRAHIQKAYWNLCKTPIVLPNKPSVKQQDYNLESISKEAAEVIKKIGDRKIVLYQGVFGYERVLDQFIEAVNLLGDEYAMLLMGRYDAEAQILLKKYPETFFIPFIPAPYHLSVTSKAHIGVLSYVNTDSIRHYDPLNALYCAPNKMYEYACFGVPMVGNDIPGLRIPFNTNNIGTCANLNSTDIAFAIKKIESNYEAMSKRCREFFNSVDIDSIVSEIVNELEQK